MSPVCICFKSVRNSEINSVLHLLTNEWINLKNENILHNVEIAFLIFLHTDYKKEIVLIYSMRKAAIAKFGNWHCNLKIYKSVFHWKLSVANLLKFV